MRTFHTGGVAGDDITHGLPRVVELFEARTPKGVAPIAEAAGRIADRGRPTRRVAIVLTPDDGSEEHALPGRPSARACSSRTATTSRSATQLVVGRDRPASRCCASSARARCRSTSSTRCRRSTAARACRSTTSTSRSSSGRCCAGSRSSSPATPTCCPASSPSARRFEDENRRVVAEGGAAGLRPSGAHGHHQGVARDRVVAVGGLLPGDHPGAHRGRDRRPSPTRCSA